MNLKINSFEEGELVVNLEMNNGTKKQYLVKNEEECIIHNIENSVDITFEEHIPSNFITRLLGYIFKFIISCLSFEEVCFSDFKCNLIHTRIKKPYGEMVEIKYSKVNLNHNKSVNMGQVITSNEFVEVDYYMCTDNLKAEFYKWQNKQFAMFIPGIIVLIIGTVFCINRFLVGAIVLLLIFLFCLVMLIKHYQNGTIYINELIDAWNYWVAKKM